MAMTIIATTKALELHMPTLMLNLSVPRHPKGIPTAQPQVVVHLLADVAAPSWEVVAFQGLPQLMVTEDMVQQGPPGLQMALLQAEDVLHPSPNLTLIPPVSSPPLLFCAPFPRSWQRRLTTVK